METFNREPVELKETSRDNETVYTWTRGNEELARVIAKGPKTYYPKIEFTIKESIIPYYEEDGESALDEIREMSMYSGMETRKENGYVLGKMKCSHNPSLGIGSFVQSVKGWISRS